MSPLVTMMRRVDAEHPTIIPMYTRAYAIGPKMNSLLSELLSARDMDATSSADLVHTQVHPRRPWRTQGPRPSVRGSEGRRRKKSQLLQAPDIRPNPRK